MDKLSSTCLMHKLTYSSHVSSLHKMEWRIQENHIIQMLFVLSNRMSITVCHLLVSFIYVSYLLSVPPVPTTNQKWGARALWCRRLCVSNYWHVIVISRHIELASHAISAVDEPAFFSLCYICEYDVVSVSFRIELSSRHRFNQSINQSIYC